MGTSFPTTLAPPLLDARAAAPPATDGVGALVGGVTATFLAAVFGATRCTGWGMGRGAKTGSDVGRLPLCVCEQKIFRLDYTEKGDLLPGVCVFCI